jgi:hypothetical protein
MFLMPIENIIQLAQQVQEMRALQKEYFATRSKSVLGDSKARERELDLLVAKILADPAAGSPSPSDFGPYLADELEQINLALGARGKSFNQFVKAQIDELLKEWETNG